MLCVLRIIWSSIQTTRAWCPSWLATSWTPGASNILTRPDSLTALSPANTSAGTLTGSLIFTSFRCLALHRAARATVERICVLFGENSDPLPTKRQGHQGLLPKVSCATLARAAVGSPGVTGVGFVSPLPYLL